MNLNKLLGSGVLAVGLAVGSGAQAAVVNIGFIMDESGSVASTDYIAAMQSLSNAIGTIPRDDPDVQYRIGVVSFSTSATVIVPPTFLTDTTIGTVQSQITGDAYSGGSTCYQCAMDTLNTAFGTLADDDISIVNMMTDGVNNTGSSATVARDGLIASNWDALSFEAVEEFGTPPDSVFLAGLAFDTGGVGGASIITDPGDIGNPLTDAFVLEVAGFGAAYDAAISAKVQRIVNPPDPNVVPLPAGLPLVLSGLGAFGVMGWRRRKAV